MPNAYQPHTGKRHPAGSETAVPPFNPGIGQPPLDEIVRTPGIRQMTDSRHSLPEIAEPQFARRAVWFNRVVGRSRLILTIAEIADLIHRDQFFILRSQV